MDEQQIREDLQAAQERLEQLKAEIYRQDGVIMYLQMKLKDIPPPANQPADPTV